MYSLILDVCTEAMAAYLLAVSLMQLPILETKSPIALAYPKQNT